MENKIKADRAKIFLPDNDLVWISANIIEEFAPGQFEVEIDDGDYDGKKSRRRRVSLETLCRSIDSIPLQNKNMTSRGVEDMCTLDYLHEPSILDNLRRRHSSFLPYTYTGDICIAVNRCITLPLIDITIYKLNIRYWQCTHRSTSVLLVSMLFILR